MMMESGFMFWIGMADGILLGIFVIPLIPFKL